MKSRRSHGTVADALQTAGDSAKSAAHDVAEGVSTTVAALGETAGDKFSVAQEQVGAVVNELGKRRRRAAKRAKAERKNANKLVDKTSRKARKNAKRAGAKATALVSEVRPAQKKRGSRAKKVLGFAAIAGLAVVVVKKVRGNEPGPITAPVRSVPRPAARSESSESSETDATG